MTAFKNAQLSMPSCSYKMDDVGCLPATVNRPYIRSPSQLWADLGDFPTSEVLCSSCDINDTWIMTGSINGTYDFWKFLIYHCMLEQTTNGRDAVSTWIHVPQSSARRPTKGPPQINLLSTHTSACVGTHIKINVHNSRQQLLSCGHPA